PCECATMEQWVLARRQPARDEPHIGMPRIRFMSNENSFLLPVLVVALGSMQAGQLAAQTFSTVHNFTGTADDGTGPYSGVISSANTLYGTTINGGGWD